MNDNDIWFLENKFYHVNFNIIDVVESLCNKIELKLIQLHNTVGFKLA